MHAGASAGHSVPKGQSLPTPVGVPVDEDDVVAPPDPPLLVTPPVPPESVVPPDEFVPPEELVVLPPPPVDPPPPSLHPSAWSATAPATHATPHHGVPRRRPAAGPERKAGTALPTVSAASSRGAACSAPALSIVSSISCIMGGEYTTPVLPRTPFPSHLRLSPSFSW